MCRLKNFYNLLAEFCFFWPLGQTGPTSTIIVPAKNKLGSIWLTAVTVVVSLTTSSAAAGLATFTLYKCVLSFRILNPVGPVAGRVVGAGFFDLLVYCFS